MSVFDQIADIFNGGPDDWAARLQPDFVMVSPEGNEFRPKWSGDSRSFGKKLGVFVFPKVKGDIVQDLDVSSTIYSIPLHFDGKDCDLNARAFFQAAKETGRWNVTHPVHGFVELQLMTIRENDEPVTSGGIITIDTEWIEPIDDTTLLTAAEAASNVNTAIDALNNSAFDQFTAALDTSTEALASGIDATVQGIANVTDFVLSPLTSSVDFLDSTMNLIQNGINDTLNATVLDVQSLAGQIQQLVITPSFGAVNLEQSQGLYDDLVEEMATLLPGTGGTLSAQEANRTLIVELAMSAAISAYGKIAVNGIQAAQAAGITIPTTSISLEGEPVATRSQAVEAAQNTADLFSDVTDSLETLQEAFETKDIDEQYFAQALSFSDASVLAARTIQFLMISAFDLKVERRFVLDRPRCPTEIAISEYNGAGEQDANIDLFIRSNNLTGDEIYLLPAGREVTVYA